MPNQDDPPQSYPRGRWTSKPHHVNLAAAQRAWDNLAPGSECPKHSWVTTPNPRYYRCVFCGQIEEIAPEFEE